jgi:hypothetical protein
MELVPDGQCWEGDGGAADRRATKNVRTSGFFPRYLLALLSSLGQSDRYCLFPAFDFAAFAFAPAFRSAAFVSVHFIFDITARTAGILTFSLLSHFSLLGL